MNKILLSICIPTNGRIEILKKTLDSIFFQVKDFSEFEVILSDNSKTDELPELLNQYQNIPNIVYQKTDAIGFLNSINALKIGNGELLKLHNNYTQLKKGSLEIMLEAVKKYQTTKPLLFFSNYTLKDISIKEYNSFNDFMYALSYFSSWSTGFSIWNTDFQEYGDIEYNEMFPHTSLLFKQVRKELYIINNNDLFYNQNIPRKGGYNLFRTFGVDYLNMLAECYTIGSITRLTFNHIREQMFISFFVPWYYATKVKKNNFTYDLTSIKNSLSIHYPLYYYHLLLVSAWCVYPLKNIWGYCFRHSVSPIISINKSKR